MHTHLKYTHFRIFVLHTVSHSIMARYFCVCVLLSISHLSVGDDCATSPRDPQLHHENATSFLLPCTKFNINDIAQDL